MNTENAAAFATTIRDQAPGRAGRNEHEVQKSSVETARAIREAAPGRADR